MTIMRGLMKTILKFKHPKEDDKFLQAFHASAWVAVCQEFDEKLRKWIKYNNDFKTPEEALQAARDYQTEILKSHNLTLFS